MRPNAPTVKCPTCNRPVEWDPDNPWRPFCSERCKLVDLGSWANGDRYIAGDPAEDAPWSEDTSDPWDLQ